ncbi:MAG: tRNA (adenosine(37)-N6)-threonylcarbamoyltransferase complex dimerization subunit type 1 TsaB [Planctomycetota bacterium]
MSVAGPVLSIDCAQRTSVLALSRAEGEAPTVRAFAAGSGAREAFWDELRALEAESGVPARSLRGVAVVLGPGGFTGLRVAVASAKGVAYALGVPAAGVPSSEVFAASFAARHGLRDARVLVALASKGDTAFVAEVAIGAEGARSAHERSAAVIGPDALEAMLRAGAPAAILSDEHLAPTLAEVCARHGFAASPLATDGGALDLLARRALAESPADPFALVPIYPREPEAVTNWRARKSMA